RFNSYVTGEVHVECGDLIPNSRRDDFVDNITKGQFYNAIERAIGLPISKEIRLRSRLSSGLQPSSALKNKDESLTRDLHQQSAICKSLCDLHSSAGGILDRANGTELLTTNNIDQATP